MDRYDFSKTSTPVAPKLTYTKSFKTPGQQATNYNNQNRAFRTDCQPRTRYNAPQATTHKTPLNRFPTHSIITSSHKTAQNKMQPLTSRLGNIFSKTPKVRPPIQQQPPKTVGSSSSSTSTSTTTTTTTPKLEYIIQVHEKRYKILKKLGTGGSAKVYEALDPRTLETVAIKIIGLAKADERSRQSYFNELSILAKLKGNQHVVHMFDSEHKVELDELVIVMEKGDRDLSQIIEHHLKTRKDQYIDGSFIRSHWRPMVKAVNEIHKLGIVHADLKPVNFIMTGHGIKLIDFGIAESVNPDCTSIIRDYQIGTINYMAPESLRNRALDASFISLNPDNGDNNNKKTVIKYNCKADIWSLGCILYNLVYGRPPFDKYKDFIGKVQAITDSNHQIQFKQLTNQRMLECMKLCLRYDFKQRPTTEDLLRHPFLTEDYIALL